MKKHLFGLLFIMGLFLTSCGDDNGPTVTITSPNNGESFMVSDVITLTGTATDDVEVTSIDVSGKDGFDLTGSIDLTGAADKSNIPFSATITIDTATPGDYTIVVTATDNDGNTESAEVDFTVQ